MVQKGLNHRPEGTQPGSLVGPKMSVSTVVSTKLKHSNSVDIELCMGQQQHANQQKEEKLNINVSGFLLFFLNICRFDMQMRRG